MGSQVELELLNTDAFIAHRGVFLLQLLGKQKVVAPHKVEIAVVEAIKQHHLRECVRQVMATKFEIHT